MRSRPFTSTVRTDAAHTGRKSLAHVCSRQPCRNVAWPRVPTLMAAVTRSRTAGVVASFTAAFVATRDRHERQVPGMKPHVESSSSLRRLELGKLPLHSLPTEFQVHRLSWRILVANQGLQDLACAYHPGPWTVSNKRINNTEFHMVRKIK